VSTVDVPVPDIGDFTDVPVIEIHVSAGDEVAAEDPLVTLESDKATMDVPAPFAGVVAQLRVSVGDRVSEGSVLLVLEQNGAVATAEAKPTEAGAAAGAAEPAREPAPPLPPADDAGERDCDVVVIGSGPGGYTAAFRAADLGLRTILVERYDSLGGVCLNVGCIPSKSLLHVARVLAEVQDMAEHGVRFGKPEIELEALLSWKQSVVDKLTGGLVGLARQRKVEVVHGVAEFAGPHSLTVGEREITFENCIIAAGSQAVSLPFLPDDDPRILDSTAALSPTSIPERLLVIGGGIIGLELATVYDALGSRVTVVELLEQLLPGCDPDLVKPLQKRISGRYEAIHVGVEVTEVNVGKKGLEVAMSGGQREVFDQVLVAVGRRPNGAALGAEAAGVEVESNGFINVDRQMRSNVPWIYAIGDVVGGPMLAHKATHEGKTAAEVIAGIPGASFDTRTIPSVAYTDPEVAWMGLTETAAREQGVEYEKAVFPWAASGRALALGLDDGFTKLLVEPGTRRVLGAGIVGAGAGELIAETVLALELGANSEDIALTVHPHPTLSETVAFAAEMAEGTITDLVPKRGRAASSSRR
jgi:dihydrolipoamide dehydrogenase